MSEDEREEMGVWCSGTTHSTETTFTMNVEATVRK
jgi:hypothetical protein